jgi:hypothetical protein
MALKIAAQSHRRNDYVPVSGVNAESLWLTAGGCCLLRSGRSMVVLVRFKNVQIFSATEDSGRVSMAEGKTIFINLKPALYHSRQAPAAGCAGGIP